MTMWRALLDLWPWLTRAERDCCHMAQYIWHWQSLAEWRRAFRAIDRDEHCHDCPLLRGALGEEAPAAKEG